MMGYRGYTIPTKYRESDVVFLFGERPSTNRNSEGFDIAVEVVSDAPSDRERDLVTKRAEYEAAAIPEYWIVDSAEQTILVLVLKDGQYEKRVGRIGDRIESEVLPGFAVDVADCLAAGDK